MNGGPVATDSYPTNRSQLTNGNSVVAERVSVFSEIGYLASNEVAELEACADKLWEAMGPLIPSRPDTPSAIASKEDQVDASRCVVDMRQLRSRLRFVATRLQTLLSVVEV